MQNRQNRFLGLVRAVQQGRVPIHSVGEHVQRAAQKMMPRDDHEPQQLSPEKKKEIKKSAVFNAAWIICKRADVQSALAKADKALHQTGVARRKTLEQHIEKLKKHNEKLQQKAVDAEQKAQEATVKAEQAASKSDAPPVLPPLPAAQPAYGVHLQQQLMGAQAGQQGGAAGAGPAKPSPLPGPPMAGAAGALKPPMKPMAPAAPGALVGAR